MAAKYNVDDSHSTNLSEARPSAVIKFVLRPEEIGATANTDVCPLFAMPQIFA